VPIHREKRTLPYPPGKMFDLVIDVDRYPEFLPWCRAARIKRREPGVLVAEMVIGFKMVREQFTSHVDYNAKDLTINTTYMDGPFKQMVSKWRFLPHPEGCLVDFYVDFEFRSSLLQSLATAFFGEVVRRMVSAFETRAKQLYGAKLPPPQTPVL
jgi:coenzyme Q-binding protein COQ10